MKKIVVHDVIHDDAMALLQAVEGIEVVNVDRDDRSGLLAAMQEADGIVLRYLPLDREAIESAPNLRVIARHGVGYDNVDMAAATERGVPVATIGDANAVTVAELTLYFMLAAAKQGPAHDRAVREGDWQKREAADAVDLYDKNVLIVGFGRVGSRVAPRICAFETNVYVYDPYISQGLIREAGYHPVSDWQQALSDMDVISLHVPLSEETRHMVDEAALGRMKQGAILVNAARGPVVDGDAVGRALEAGRLFGVGFDVFDPEPPSENNAIVRCSRSILTPHVGALTRECSIRSAVRSAQNVLDAFEERLDVSCVVNPEVL